MASVSVISGGMKVGNTNGVNVIPISGDITASTGGAGGLFGYYKNTGSVFDLKDYNITATESADNCGGVFGVLENSKGTNTNASVSLTMLIQEVRQHQVTLAVLSENI